MTFSELRQWVFGEQSQPMTPIADTKVASNVELLKLLDDEIVTEHFLGSMTEHIRKNGLTFGEREFITQVIDRIPLLNEEPRELRETARRERA